MTTPSPSPASFEFVRQLADQAFARSAGAPLVEGNAVTPLFDCTDNFPAWAEAIAGATDCVYIEMYIFAADAYGTRIRDLLAERAKAGVRVCLLYDWLGCWKEHYRGFFKPIAAAGGEIRAYNPPAMGDATSLLGRNHRKLIVVDGRVAFIGGLCISSHWEGDSERNLAPWRDTGLKLEGPIVRDALLAFADSWASTGAPLPADALPATPPPAGEVEARLIATTPDTAYMMRLDLLIASFARRTLWLSDAYFMASGLYMTALKHAAQDGVDVRLLVPRSSDIGWIATVSRTLYRPLLQAGVRVYEWDGPMMHGKTAVADGRWARVGSTNLNYSSWFSNREVDVAIEDTRLAGGLAERFLKDLENSTEIVLAGRKPRPVMVKPRRRAKPTLLSPSLVPRERAAAVRQAARIGDAFGAVVRGTRLVDASEAAAFLTIGLFFVALALLTALFPYLVAAPVALLSLLSGGAITLKAVNLYRARRRRKLAEAAALTAASPAPPDDAPPAQ
ncbi:phospholipase D-like domain-containing protein [Crenobacter cavernae]|uniref:Phosphatidylserine/phosphatidylglycerophosphate/ cardiolipin synthase family protein n=1 Tax=Crenobacter cavernae TaxID=2290923 RepID=A0A345Y5Z5_9NEIS|nr:phosphatidylserine/phosphatidylglycerophosphate/cardiolipin synthase family protein [Crenobacter cavernae]AXK39347.1 phosphatidylserine/phosphatidylglycerophosphate/cardiolipin synthase family protein [Crenobacter cavernae]